MTSKRRLRRIRGKMQAATVAKRIGLGLYRAEAEYGPESIAVLAGLDRARRQPDYFITSDMSDEVRINAALRFIFRDADRANAWLKAPNRVFSDRSAQDVMSDAGGAERVREYLESKAEEGFKIDDFGRLLLAQKGSIPPDADLEF